VTLGKGDPFGMCVAVVCVRTGRYTTCSELHGGAKRLCMPARLLVWDESLRPHPLSARRAQSPARNPIQPASGRLAQALRAGTRLPAPNGHADRRTRALPIPYSIEMDTLPLHGSWPGLLLIRQLQLTGVTTSEPFRWSRALACLRSPSLAPSRIAQAGWRSRAAGAPFASLP
jgi:hypothetical protein